MFKSIRVKLTLSYIIIILVSMLVTGFFFQWRMMRILEKNIMKEVLAQAGVLSGAISSISKSYSNLVKDGGNLTHQYQKDKKTKLGIYSAKGYLIADSQEPGIGFLNPNAKRLINQISGKENITGEQYFIWVNPLPDRRAVIHTTFPLFTFKVTGASKYNGAVDISVMTEKPGETINETTLKKMIKTGERVVDSYYFSRTDKLRFIADSLIKHYPFDSKYRVRIYDKSRLILAGNQHIDSYEFQKIQENKDYHWIKKIAGERFLFVAVPIREKSSKPSKGYIVMSRSLASVDAMYLIIRNVFFYAIGISLIVTIIFSLILAFTLIRPITNIRDVASDIAGGNFSARVNYSGKDEIRSLADTINNMAGRIQSNINQITEDKDKINALLAALPDGVIALGYDGQVRFLNNSSARFIQSKPCDAIGKNIFEFFDGKEVKIFFKEAIKKGGLNAREFSIPPWVLRLYLIPYGEKDKRQIESGLMMIIRDVTDLKRLEETRTRFLGSVSHELRTPLTIIKGFIHTVIDDDVVINNKSIQHVFDVIERETDRLSRLVNDLLELSRFRSKKLSMEMGQCDIDNIVSDTVNQMLPNAERMTIDLKLNLGANGLVLYGDKDRLKQVVINVVDNAVKYTPSGGKVKVTTCKNEKCWEMNVQDTGMGIPKSEIPFLYERFFRTKDKKKKKYIKGTGLGMAIVKEIVDAHQGEIKVDSKEGQGTSIIVCIPIKIVK